MVRTEIQTRVVVMEHVGMKEGSGCVRTLFFGKPKGRFDPSCRLTAIQHR